MPTAHKKNLSTFFLPTSCSYGTIHIFKLQPISISQQYYNLKNAGSDNQTTPPIKGSLEDGLPASTCPAYLLSKISFPFTRMLKSYHEELLLRSRTIFCSWLGAIAFITAGFL